jgi:hypothetical protein
VDEMPASGHVHEEPQEERGGMGSRDEGGPPAAGPTDRQPGKSDADDHTSIDPQEPGHGDSETLQAGGG